VNKNKPINPLPFNVYLGTVAALALVGLLDSTYLAISHYRNYTDISYRSFCAISRALNCDTVSQSSYALFLDLPVAVWGIFGYAFLLILLLLTSSKDACKKRIWSLIFWLSFAFTCGSVILALVSTLRIRSYCIMCIVTYGVNFILVYYAWLIRRRFSNAGLIEDTREDLHFLWHKRAKCIPLFVFFIATVLSTWLFFPTYWYFEPPPLTADIPHGFTEAGHPWIGAKRPVLKITEFADYQCFQCKKMHFFLRQFISQNPEKIRIIHRHYPMDQKFNPIVKEPFHLGAGKMALLAIAAGSKKRFWEMNDLLYSIDRNKKVLSANELAEAVGLDPYEIARAINTREIRYQLHRDIREGNEMGITGTPAYVVDGKLYLGQLPAEILKKIMQ
jgi:protein-disulfide isomerase/uncharacterized membrane protein